MRNFGRSLPILLSFLACDALPAGEENPRPGTEGTAVLLELFTSQGCSSCPPADRLLARLAAEEGSGVVPLAYHVDYWNYIGWTDPFSSARWSERQSRYARRAFDTGRVYTPQVVVDGEADCVGSNEKRVRREIERARSRADDGELTLAVRSAASADRLALEIGARVLRAAPGETWDVMVALFEDDLVTPVPRGENGGRTLENSRVVRALAKAFSLPAEAGAERSQRWEIDLGEGWKRSDLGVAAFLQDPESMRVHGAAVRDRIGVR